MIRGSKAATDAPGSSTEPHENRDEAPHVATPPPVRSLLLSPDRERAAISEGRAQAAMTNSTLAHRAASKKLEKCRRARRLSSGASVAVGLLGIAYLLFIIHNPETSLMTNAFSALAAVAACMPPLHMALRIGEAASIESRTLVEAQKTSMLIAQAKLMGRAVVAVSEDQGLSRAKNELLDILLSDLEKVAQAQKESAGFLRRDTAGGGQTRRDVRICPNIKRVYVTIGNLPKFAVRIIDVSLSGVAVKGHLPGVGVGSEAVVGARKARVVRLLPQGAAFEFATPIQAEQFDETIVL